MGRGFVAQVSKEGIRVALDKRLRPAFAGHAQRAPKGNLPGPGSLVLGAGGAPPEETALLSWRLDKDDVASVFVRLRRNLMGALWMPDVMTLPSHSTSLLQFVVCCLLAATASTTECCYHTLFMWELVRAEG